MQKEADKIDLALALVKDFSELNFPNYKTRDFWNNLPESIQNEYIKKAERYLNYDWPVVKATDYLEFIRSGDRRQEAYEAPRSRVSFTCNGRINGRERSFYGSDYKWCVVLQ